LVSSYGDALTWIIGLMQIMLFSNAFSP